jgi:predicted alpha/beta superfamily hydrolase
LADTAYFAQEMQAKGYDGPWILIGSSYSANLVTWARLKYPDIFFGALASSAPIVCQLEVPEFLEEVSNAMERTSPGCPGVIQSASDELAALVSSGDSARISELFK